MTDEDEYQNIIAAQKKIREEIRKVKELVEQYDTEIRTSSRELEERNPGIQNPFVMTDLP